MLSKLNLLKNLHLRKEKNTWKRKHSFSTIIMKNSRKKLSVNFVIDEGKRIDGRRLNEVRPIWIEIDYLPSTHGSAVFTRGETQSLTSLHLGTKNDEVLLDNALDYQV